LETRVDGWFAPYAMMIAVVEETRVDSVFGQTDSVAPPAALTARVALAAKRAFGDQADESTLERCAQEAVADVWRESIRVKTFVPVLALRRVREMLEGGQADDPLKDSSASSSVGAASERSR
jgi:hypothetical protein